MGEEINNEMIENVEAVTTEEQTGTKGNEEREIVAEKKYTDADVDKIIARKIAAERKRMSKLFNEEQQENELDIRERNVLRRELKADAKDALIEQGYPSSLANIMNYESEEDFKRSFEEVINAFREAVQIGIKDALRGNHPIHGRNYSKESIINNSNDNMIREAFAPKAR